MAWDELANLRLDPQNPWFEKYIAFIDALVRRAAGRYPVSHGTLIGPSDIAALLRGHTQSVLDLVEAPDEMRRLLGRCGDVFRQITEEAWKHIPLYHGGYYDAQYQLWSPGPIVRLQEDASGVLSPRLYREFLQPVDREVAGRFPSAFIHLHSNSMFLYDLFLEVEEIRCFQVNYELHSGGPPIAGMIPAFRKIQAAGRPLLVRGSFTPDELRLLVDSLDPRGLYLYIMVGSLAEVEPCGRCWGVSPHDHNIAKCGQAGLGMPRLLAAGDRRWLPQNAPLGLYTESRRLPQCLPLPNPVPSQIPPASPPPYQNTPALPIPAPPPSSACLHRTIRRPIMPAMPHKTEPSAGNHSRCLAMPHKPNHPPPISLFYGNGTIRPPVPCAILIPTKLATRFAIFEFATRFALFYGPSPPALARSKPTRVYWRGSWLPSEPMMARTGATYGT